MNYTMISLPNPPNDNQSPTIETTAQFAQLLDIGDGMDIGQRLASVVKYYIKSIYMLIHIFYFVSTL